MPQRKDQQQVYIQSHLNAPKLRIDTWNRLAEIANEMHYTTNIEQCQSFEHEVKYCLEILKPIECYHAFPGNKLCQKVELLFYQNDFQKFYELVTLIVQALRSTVCNYKELLKILEAEGFNQQDYIKNTEEHGIHYFEVLVVEELSEVRKAMLKQELENYTLPDEKFIYELVFVNSVEDAIIAVMFNFNIKCCLISDFFRFDSDAEMPAFRNLIEQALIISRTKKLTITSNHAVELANILRNLRENELDIYYLCSSEPEKNAANISNSFNKIFYDFEYYFDLHLNIVQGIREHYETPFFDSLKKYTFEPKSTFHALPIARGKSVFNSRWIHDMQEFYGNNIFLAESSSTAGGLDSLMNPIGSISKAMKKAKNFFGSHETYFVTNGTSASNKIVLQSLLKPGDIVLMEHSCHESHHYGIILTGAYPVYLNGYHLKKCDISGPVPLRIIKEQLLSLKKANLLDRVKLILLTNCTFDGLVYNVNKYMEEILAIKPDIIFFWDEAWFAFARCVPHYRLRTAMHSAASLEARFKEASYKEEYEKFKLQLANSSDPDFLLNSQILPDPDKVVIRVYATQSTHKSLSCLRQGSMIHIYDNSFRDIRENFIHAYLTHSTTSPNYQILATMDLARRQAELEGFELVQHAIELAMIFRQQVNNHPFISEYFLAAGPSELIPLEFRKASRVRSGYDPSKDWGTVEKAWIADDIVIDPTRVTLIIKEGLTGYALRQILMDRFGIQVNKVSFNSILIQFNIGTLRSSVSYLLDTLFTISNELKLGSALKQDLSKGRTPLPLPPDFSEFTKEFLCYPNSSAGNLRKAFYAGQNEQDTEYLTLGDLIHRVKSGEKIVCASIIIPVPPGYPVLLPGQIITETILDFLAAIDPGCILGGYSPSKGIKVFK